MYIKKWEYRDGQFEFHKGINIVYGDNIYDFDTIALFLSSLCENKYHTYIHSFTDYFSYGHDTEILKCELVYKDKKYNIKPTFQNGDLNISMMDCQCDYKEFVDKMDKPTFLYLRSNIRFGCEVIHKYEDYNQYRQMSDGEFYCSFVKNNFVLEQKFWGNLFMKNLFSPTDYTKYHCEKLCEIINEMILVNNYYGFDFSLKNGCFVAYNNGAPKIVAHIREKDVGLQIMTIMSLYMMFLVKHDDGYINNISEDDGIVLLNLEFGERPSYSDKKWKYYDVFLKYFPNMQFIVL